MAVFTSIGVVVLLPARFQPVLSDKGYETEAAQAAKNKDEQEAKPMMRLATQTLPGRWKHLPSKRNILIVKHIMFKFLKGLQGALLGRFRPSSS